MPGFVKTKEDERLWAKAKGLAEEQDHKEDWPYVTGIFKKMKGGKVAGARERVAARYLYEDVVTLDTIEIMSDDVLDTCPTCEGPLEVSPQKPGLLGRCPSCQVSFVNFETACKDPILMQCYR